MTELERILGPPLKLPARLASWEMHFRVAAAEHGLDPLLLAAVCDRESAGGSMLLPKGPLGTGDGGHGKGLMQIDDRSWNTWLAQNDWRDALTNIRKGAEILADCIAKTENLRFPLRAGVAAYNSGVATARRTIERGADVDIATTNANYSADVLKRAAGFRLMQGSSLPTGKDSPQ